MIYPIYNKIRPCLMLLLLCFQVIAEAQPANDDCANAQFLSKTGTYTGSTMTATADLAGGICDEFRTTTKGIWYQLIGNGGNVRLSTCGEQTDFDTWLGVYQGNCEELTCVAENDDLATPCTFAAQAIFASKASEVGFKAEFGVIYYILVGGTQLETGNFTLGVFCEGGEGDCIAPLKLISTTRKSPTSIRTNSDELVFLATFNNSVMGVEAADFKVEGSTATIEVTKLTDSTYDLTLKGGDLMNLNGEIMVTIASTASITDLKGNALAPEAPEEKEGYILDNTAPLITSFTRNSPNTIKTNADELTFLATFNEPVIEVDATDFKVNGPAGNIEVTKATTSTYLVTIKGANITNYTGNVGLDFVNMPEGLLHNLSILDSAGNAFLPIEPTIDEVYQVDNTPPTVTINQANEQGDPTKGATINFEVVFSEAVTQFTKEDITINGTAGATTATVEGSGTTYTIAITGMTNSGTVMPTIAANIAIDEVGNKNTASTSTDNEVIYDIIAPTVATFSPTNNSIDIATNTKLSIQFNEAIQKGSGDIRIYKKTDDELVETIAINSDNVTIDETMVTVIRQMILEVDAEYYIQMDNGGIQDLATNAYAGIDNKTDWTFKTIANILTISAINNSQVLENSEKTLDFVFEASAAPNADLTINYTIAGMAINGTDYDTLTGQVMLGQGMTTVTVKVTPIGDTTIESDESVMLTLARGNQYEIGNLKRQTGTILNDDFCPILGNLSTPTAICQGETFTINIDELAKMNKDSNGNQDFGIQWVAFSEAMENPYIDGINLGRVPFNELTGTASSQTATLSMAGQALTAGDYAVYAILSPLPADPTCRPFKKIDLTVKPLPTPKLTSDNIGLICSGTNVQFTVSGGLSYEFFLNNNRVLQGAMTTYNNTNLVQGDALKVIATNEFSCKATSNTFIAQVNSTDTDGDNVPDCRDVCPGGDDLGADKDKDEVPDDCDCDMDNAEDAIVVVRGLFGQITTGIYKAGKSLSTEQTVNAENVVTFQAGEGILLKPGFLAVSGSTFHAFIAPCKSPSTLIENETIVTQSLLNLPLDIINTPLTLSLAPNPFNDQTYLSFQLSNEEEVSLTIYDQTGHVIKQLVLPQKLAIGHYQILLNQTDLKGKGFYYAVLQTTKERITQKVIVLN